MDAAVAMLLLSLFVIETRFCLLQHLVQLDPIHHLQEDSSTFHLSYGNTLSKRISSDKPGLNDRISEYLSQLFKKTVIRVCNSSSCLSEPLHLSQISRFALFLTTDGETPLQFQLYWINSSGKQVYQNRVMSTGVLYLFVVDLICGQEVHSFNITLMERNDSFYLYNINKLSNEELSQHSESLSVLTLNIWNMNSRSKTQTDYLRRLEFIISEIKRTLPDIIGLQEVRFDSRVSGKLSPNQVEHFWGRLPEYHFIYQPANFDTTVDLPTNKLEEGLVILSRYPVVDWSYILLPSNSSLDVHQRICLHAHLSTPSLPHLHVFVTHLSLNQQLRLLSVREILRFMRMFEGHTLLMGDMNAEPSSEEMHFVRENGMQDAWLRFYPEPEVRTSEVVEGGEERFYGLTFDATESYLRKRIDFIYFNQTLLPLADSIELFGPHGGASSLSDHLGVLFRLTNGNIIERDRDTDGRLKVEL